MKIHEVGQQKCSGHKYSDAANTRLVCSWKHTAIKRQNLPFKQM